MILETYFGEEKEQSYQADRAAMLHPVQRWLVLAGGSLYCLAGMWLSFRAGDPAEVIGTYSLALLAFTLVLFGLSYLRFLQERSELIPILFALGYSVHISLGVVDLPLEGSIRFAVQMGFLCIYLVAISPTLLISLAAITAAVIIAVLSTVFLFPLQNVPVELLTAFGYLVPALAIAFTLAFIADRTAREAFSFKWELSRRATTDELSGVANRTHIYVLAGNEYSRAQRYREPFSCLMFEIDGLEAIRDTWGDHAAATICRVFAGYCVLVMRHCDSFGRLSERQFLALLPETPGQGALVLAKRMVDDLGRLEVNVYGEVLHFSVSVGVAEMCKADQTGTDLLRRAEQGLNDAIEQGRQQAIFASPPPQQVGDGDPLADNPAPVTPV
jgi:diguanylate cyclase (GGDEF)-like protein